MPTFGFGVCLGLQSLASQYDAKVKRLPLAKHGQMSVLERTGTVIFEGVGAVEAVRYYSLYAELSGNEDPGEPDSTFDVSHVARNRTLLS